MRAKFDWSAVRTALEGKVSKEDATLLDLLAAGKSTPQIAAILREHRSRVWRRSQLLKQRLTVSDSSSGTEDHK